LGTAFYDGDWVEMRISIDFANNKAALATTFQRDLHFDAVLPTPMDYNTQWTFDSSTRFYFGGISPSTRISITPLQLSVWDSFLPVLDEGVEKPRVGDFLLGHSPTLIKEFLFEEGSGFALADSLNENSPAYLGFISKLI